MKTRGTPLNDVRQSPGMVAIDPGQFIGSRLSRGSEGVRQALAV